MVNVELIELEFDFELGEKAVGEVEESLERVDVSEAERAVRRRVELVGEAGRRSKQGERGDEIEVIVDAHVKGARPVLGKVGGDEGGEGGIEDWG